MDKRKRGRPPGSSWRNEPDLAVMMKAAGIMAASGDERLTPSLRQLGVTSESDQRRLRRKWDAAGPHLLLDARNRLRPPYTPRQKLVTDPEVLRSIEGVRAFLRGESAVQKQIAEASQNFVRTVEALRRMGMDVRNTLDKVRPALQVVQEVMEQRRPLTEA